MEIKGSVTILFSDEGMVIEVRDDDAAVNFLNVKLNQKQTCQVLSRLGNVKPEKCEVFGLHKIGKKMEHETLEFEFPDNTTYSNRENLASEIAKTKCPEGWEPDLYFGSKNSFYYENGKFYARCTIRRWI